MADRVRVKVKVRVGGHLTRERYDAHGASVDPVGTDGAVLTLFDAHDRPTTTILWPANVVKVILTREYEAPPPLSGLPTPTERPAMGDLRERLVAASLASEPRRDDLGRLLAPTQRTNTAAASQALTVVADWLRELAKAKRGLADQTENQTGRTVLIAGADTLEYAAGLITSGGHYSGDAA